MLIDISLWSADLANLEAEIRRLEPVADSFHLDVADGHFVPALLFFPDLVARLRGLTRKPLHVHLMVTDPVAWIGPFRDAGADWITVPLEAGFADGADGVSLALDTPCEAVRSLLPRLNRIVMMGTPVGVKGCDLDARACPRLAEMKRLIAGAEIALYADGAIRAHTVGPLRQAGADAVVAGSLVCQDLAWADRIRSL